MKNINPYLTSYQDSKERLEYLKYGLFNEYGPNLDFTVSKEKQENNVPINKCNIHKES